MSEIYMPSWISTVVNWLELIWSKSEACIAYALNETNLWSGFWPAIFGATAGALIAFYLERWRNEADRIRRELGQCHTMVFMLNHVLSALEDFNEQLFEAPAKKLDGPADWYHIGAFEGAPDQGPGFAIGDYTFLIDGSDRQGNAPKVLSDIYRATENYKAILRRLNRRTQLCNEYLPYRAVPMGRGEEALSRIGESVALEKQIEELTQWLREDIPEQIEVIRNLLPQLYAIMGVRYPKQQFINAQPIDSAISMKVASATEVEGRK